MPRCVFLIANMAGGIGSQAVDQDRALARTKFDNRLDSVFGQQPEQEIHQRVARCGANGIEVVRDSAIQTLLRKYLLEYLLIGPRFDLLQDVPINEID